MQAIGDLFKRKPVRNQLPHRQSPLEHKGRGFRLIVHRGAITPENFLFFDPNGCRRETQLHDGIVMSKQ